MPEGLTLPAACHSHVNHTLSELRADEKNPFSHGDYCWENDMSLESQNCARLQAAIPDLVLALFEAVQRAHDQEGESNSGSGRTCFSCLLVSPR